MTITMTVIVLAVIVLIAVLIVRNWHALDAEGRLIIIALALLCVGMLCRMVYGLITGV